MIVKLDLVGSAKQLCASKENRRCLLGLKWWHGRPARVVRYGARIDGTGVDKVRAQRHEK